MQCIEGRVESVQVEIVCGKGVMCRGECAEANRVLIREQVNGLITLEGSVGVYM